ncbi:MAG: hypothetical protein IIC03_10160 [Proteobacteria bacterium]|nr:hypothetical protein [Pseudomonadota bacterium]
MTNPRERKRARNRAWTGAIAAGLVMASLATVKAAEVISFAEDIYPIIQIRCLACHVPGGAGHEASGLDLRTYQGLMKGTRHGPMVVPGNVIESNLLTLIDGRAKLHMPFNRKLLTKCERLAFRRWVQQGAKDN